DKGRRSAFFTGVGAAVSDLIYCLLTGFGLSFIEDFINTHRSPIQLLGSLVLIFFGIWLVRKKPDGSIAADADHGSPSREGDILKGFALTFSNPLILFLIIGLFAQFNFVIEGIKFYHYMLGFLGIIAGALGWWWVVTYFVDKLRGHFNHRTMKLINVVVGIIILIFAAVGIVSSTATLLSASGKNNPTMKSDSMTVSFRVADTAMKGWYADFSGEDGDILRFEVIPVSKPDPFGDSKVDALSVKAVSASGEVLGEATVVDGIDPYKGKNSWRIVRVGGSWNLFVGNREYRHILSFTYPFAFTSGPDIVSLSVGGICVSDYDVSVGSCKREDTYADELMSVLREIDAAGRQMAGVYSLLDYEQDDSYAVIGGNYRIAVLPADSAGFFDIFYIDGAKANSAHWTCGMKKGRLRPTHFAEVFDVEWRDAEGAWMLNDVQADHDPLAATLIVKFPYQNSSMRFRKVAF
ncbi:MAG: LysE family translocator, partial [Muribaculaceae bacterium]|nr:LysE family translocator [Muribaculaceae bacterium]